MRIITFCNAVSQKFQMVLVGRNYTIFHLEYQPYSDSMWRQMEGLQKYNLPDSVLRHEAGIVVLEGVLPEDVDAQEYIYGRGLYDIPRYYRF